MESQVIHWLGVNQQTPQKFPYFMNLNANKVRQCWKMSKSIHLVYCHRGGKTPVDNQMSEAEEANLGLDFLLKIVKMIHQKPK